MKLIKPSFEIWEQSAGLEGVYKQIEKVGRVCYKSEDKITEDSAKPFVDRMIKSGHGAMLEHGTVYLKFETLTHAEKYLNNKYSEVRTCYCSFYVTTNLRVLVENGWLTTYGLGELISAALSRGCRHFIIGIGGSATNDAGIGMLTALGYHFYQEDGSRVKGYGRDLAKIVRIDDSEVSPLLRECRFDIACDVTNPLCGSEGCSHVFGPQKGATPEIAARMDADIARFAALAERFTGKAASLIPGAGAAGGLGFAFHTFLNGSLTPGITLVLEAIHIADALPSADLVITGEGRMDHQTAMGKAPVGVAQLAKRCAPSCRTIALCGCAAEEAASVNEHGIDAYFPILHEAMDAEEAMRKDVTTANLRQTVTQVLRLIHD